MEQQPDEALAQAGAVLADRVESVLPAWVERAVERRLSAFGGRADAEIMAGAAEAGRRARDEVGGRVRALLQADVDDQRATPLSLLRTAVAFPTEVLRRAGVPPVRRDDYEREAFPDDDYGLTPASFVDIDPALAEAGVLWGVAKAWAHRRRHATGSGRR